MTPAYEVSPDYFRAAGIRIVDGRDFALASTEPAVIVSSGFAARQWPGQKAVGQRFRVGNGEWLTVVGVAAEVREMSEDDTTGDTEVYYPRGGLNGAMYATAATSQIAAYETILIRTSRPELAAQIVARAVREVDARVVVSRTTLAAHQFAQSIARPRIVLLLMSVFGAFGLVLAAGGSLAHDVVLRRKAGLVCLSPWGWVRPFQQSYFSGTSRTGRTGRTNG